MELMLLLMVPLAAGLLCFATNSRAWWERLNLGAFAIVAGLTVKVAGDVGASGTVTALGGFLRADALSALVLALTGFVSLVCSIYAVGYFRRDESAGKITRRNCGVITCSRRCSSAPCCWCRWRTTWA